MASPRTDMDRLAAGDQHMQVGDGPVKPGIELSIDRGEPALPSLGPAVRDGGFVAPLVRGRNGCGSGCRWQPISTVSEYSTPGERVSFQEASPCVRVDGGGRNRKTVRRTTPSSPW